MLFSCATILLGGTLYLIGGHTPGDTKVTTTQTLSADSPTADFQKLQHDFPQGKKNCLV